MKPSRVLDIMKGSAPNRASTTQASVVSRKVCFMPNRSIGPLVARYKAPAAPMVTALEVTKTTQSEWPITPSANAGTSMPIPSTARSMPIMWRTGRTISGEVTSSS